MGVFCLKNIEELVMKKTFMSLAIASCFAMGTTLTQADSQENHGHIIKSDTPRRSSTTGISGGMSASETLGTMDPSGSTRVIDPSGTSGVMGLPGTSGGMDPSGPSGEMGSSGSNSGSAGRSGH
jgi:hypothetical protein